MKHFLITISIVLSLLFANVEPILSQSKCIHCGMDIVTEEFLAMADLTTGVIVEFDAIECLVNYIKPKNSKEFSNLWVTDYTTTLYRNYNGIQMDEKWGVNTSLRYIAI